MSKVDAIVLTELLILSCSSPGDKLDASGLSENKSDMASLILFLFSLIAFIILSEKSIMSEVFSRLCPSIRL